VFFCEICALCKKKRICLVYSATSSTTTTRKVETTTKKQTTKSTGLAPAENTQTERPNETTTTGNILGNDGIDWGTVRVLD
jgi:hypothetical protein